MLQEICRIKIGAKQAIQRIDPAKALEEIGPETKAAALTKLLDDEDNGVCNLAEVALKQIDSEANSTVKILVQDFNDGDEDARINIAKALGEIGPQAKQAVPFLIQGLKDMDNGVRHNVAKALGNIGPEAKDAIPGLIQLLEDESWIVRDSAEVALRQISSEDKKTDKT